MTSGSKKKFLGLFLVLFVCFFTCSPTFQSFASFPEQLRLFDGEAKELRLSMPVHAQVTVKNPDIVAVNGASTASMKLSLQQPISLQTQRSGQTEVKLKLFGKIPLKTVKVDVLPQLSVIPGGQTIGVKMKSKGILVVGHHLVETQDRSKVSPGERAKLQIGDHILTMNGSKLQHIQEVTALVEAAGRNKKPLDLLVLRNGTTFQTQIYPEYDISDQAYRLGIYIRDSAAGVGTLTFYAPQQKVYGALGHIITDMDTQMPIVVGGGQIVHSNVTSIAKSQHGDPGEKRAVLVDEDQVIGNIVSNTDFGIFGKMNKAPPFPNMQRSIPVAFADEVKVGPAQIYTVVDGQTVEQFAIEIVHVAKQTFPATKGMIIKIKDPRLLDKTGGIVQGMSGSPIVQNGKLVGAVTHVFVNDPTSGYGCFIEWMLRDAGVLKSSQLNPKAS